MFLFDVGSIDAVTSYILAIVPAVTAIVGMIVVIGVGIGKIKNALQGNEEKVEKISSRTKEIQKENIELKKALSESKKTEAEFKKALIELNKKINIMTVTKKEE